MQTDYCAILFSSLNPCKVYGLENVSYNVHGVLHFFSIHNLLFISYNIFFVEVTAGLRKSKVMPEELDPFDTKLSNLVKYAKKDYEIMVKKYSNINAECK